MIGIINYGVGNIGAFATAYKRMGVPTIMIDTPAELKTVSKLILPGVGSFDHAMQRLKAAGFAEPLKEQVLEHKKPILGICVGMQMLAGSSEEGIEPGLNFIDTKVSRLLDEKEQSAMLRLPHMGWNRVEHTGSSQLWGGIDSDSRFYFLHSFGFNSAAKINTIGTTSLGHRSFCSAINQANIYGVQFHPEKSHSAGSQLLKNFSEL